jgi:uncharacterized glyoxalase superfamily protein PhnB
MALDLKGMTPLLQVFDMPTSMNFYCDTLGFEVFMVDDPKKAPNHDWVWLKRGEIELMLNTAYESGHRPATADARRIAAHDDVCFYFSAPDVDAVYEELSAKGLTMGKPKIAPYGMKQLYLHDPDGYNLCFQWRADGQN